MRTLALLLFLGVPVFALASPPRTPAKRVRVTVINMSGQRREIALRDGRLRLPEARRVDVYAEPGGTIHIVSEMDSRVDYQLRVPPTAETQVVEVP